MKRLTMTVAAIALTAGGAVSAQTADETVKPKDEAAQVETNAEQNMEAAENNLEQAGENMEQAAENTGDAIENGAKKAGDAMENAANDAGQAIDNAADKAEAKDRMLSHIRTTLASSSSSLEVGGGTFSRKVMAKITMVAKAMAALDTLVMAVE